MITKPILFSTGSEEAMLAGNVVAIVSGGVICIVISVVKTWGSPPDPEEVWERTRDIDNPLSPWTEAYAK